MLIIPRHHSGNMITECNSQRSNRYLNILGFVEVSNLCPAEKTSYHPPEQHAMVQILQQHVERHQPLVEYQEYHHHLTVRDHQVPECRSANDTTYFRSHMKSTPQTAE